MNRDDRLFRLLKQGGVPEFRAGFVDRVMARLEGLPVPARPVFVLPTNLQRYSLRLIPIAAALVIALGLYNLAGRQSTSQSALDAFLGLPAVTLAAAYSLDVSP